MKRTKPLLKELVGKVGRVVSRFETKAQNVFEPGTSVIIISVWRGRFTLRKVGSSVVARQVPQWCVEVK